MQDKHFSDAWVIAWGPGFHADLASEWEPFRAARAALAGVACAPRAKELAVQHAALLPQLQAQLGVFVQQRTFTVSMRLCLPALSCGT